MLYGRLPSEILALTPGELYLNFLIAFPESKEAGDLKTEHRARERAMGYSPTKMLLHSLKGNKT
jgi:hypothetical protein